jgi:hypothetical protein
VDENNDNSKSCGTSNLEIGEDDDDSDDDEMAVDENNENSKSCGTSNLEVGEDDNDSDDDEDSASDGDESGDQTDVDEDDSSDCSSEDSEDNYGYASPRGSHRKNPRRQLPPQVSDLCLRGLRPNWETTLQIGKSSLRIN